eukprot:11207872-Alexandrium_andersonii.AAC.1
MEALVQAVKNFQTSSQQRRAAWHEYCDKRARGVRGPARLAPEVIERFFAEEEAASGRGDRAGAYHSPRPQSRARPVFRR